MACGLVDVSTPGEPGTELSSTVGNNWVALDSSEMLLQKERECYLNTWPTADSLHKMFAHMLLLLTVWNWLHSMDDDDAAACANVAWTCVAGTVESCRESVTLAGLSLPDPPLRAARMHFV